MPALSQTEWKWRVVFATVGTLSYWPLFHPDWRNPFLLLYDVPTLCVTWGFAGSLLYQTRYERRKKTLRSLAALLIAVVLATGAQYADWPISGHLTIATVTGVVEYTDSGNPRLLRVAVLLPIILLVLIRTFWPQMPQMTMWGTPFAHYASVCC